MPHSWTQNPFTFRSLRHVFAQIWINEGPKALLRGYWATIFGVIPYAGTSFFTFETLKRKHHGKQKPLFEFMIAHRLNIKFFSLFSCFNQNQN